MANKKTYEDAIEELSLMLMYLTREQDRNDFCRYREISWKGSDFGLLDKLGQEEMIYQPRSRRGYDKYLYLTEEGRRRAKALLEEYGLSDKDLNERFLFRDIRPEEAGQAAEIERICFPPHEACTEAKISLQGGLQVSLQALPQTKIFSGMNFSKMQACITQKAGM